KSSANPVPMCGVPYHALNTYLPRMIKSGFKVAICEQMEDPKQAKGIVRREVARVITPGTVMDPAMLEERSHNFLVAITTSKRGFGLCAVDLSTGLLKVCEFIGDNSMTEFLSELDKIDPKQVLIPENLEEAHPPLFKELSVAYGSITDLMEGWVFDVTTAQEVLLNHFSLASLDGFGLEGMDLCVSSAGAVISYLRDTQKGALNQITSVTIHNPTDHMMLDTATRRNLELTKNLMDGSRKGSLLELVDETETAMGARQLNEWLLRPLISVEKINERLDAVRFLVEDSYINPGIVDALTGMGDMERIASRVVQPNCSPRDLLLFGQALQKLPELGLAIEMVNTSFGRVWRELWDELPDTRDLLARAIADEPPIMARDGGAIREGYSEELDALRSIKSDSRKLIVQLENDEKKRTGISNLRIKYNKIYGYFIEVSRRQSETVPEEWMRKQSLVNSERFISPKLKELEEKIMTAEERAIEVELRLFENVKTEAAKSAPRAQGMAAIVGEIDALSALAHLAQIKHYTAPVVNDGDAIEIKGGRHPIIEEAELTERFVPNDTTLDRTDNQLSIITGPNMAGKSTYIRQVAIITLLAQIGSYVPADSATIGVCDRIFTRVGAQDHLQKGQSTFMVEMNETAMILNNATARSLIILDEIGRGTSTFDGISIAWAVAEYIHKIGARTLFATHYHELTELAETMQGVRNLSVAVKEWNDEIIFLRKIIEEGADKSYGIQVARLAGLPKEVIERSGEILSQLEANEVDSAGLPKLKAKDAEGGQDYQISLFAPQVSEVEEELRKLDVDGMTPLDALNKLSELKKKV
ncbi:DNA mismatch repair protein MutS, partial [hydrothermal vent metagenome]